MRPVKDRPDVMKGHSNSGAAPLTHVRPKGIEQSLYLRPPDIAPCWLFEDPLEGSLMSAAQSHGVTIWHYARLCNLTVGVQRTEPRSGWGPLKRRVRPEFHLNLHLMNRSEAAPCLWASRLVKNSKNYYSFCFNEIEHSIREAFQQDAPQIFDNDLEVKWALTDQAERVAEFVDEVVSESRQLPVVPVSGSFCVSLSAASENEISHETEAGAPLRPRAPRRGAPLGTPVA